MKLLRPTTAFLPFPSHHHWLLQRSSSPIRCVPHCQPNGTFVDLPVRRRLLVGSRARICPPVRVFASPLLDSEHSDDDVRNGEKEESSLQNLYKQVQQNDSEWYLSTLAKYLEGEQLMDTTHTLDLDVDRNEKLENENFIDRVVGFGQSSDEIVDQQPQRNAEGESRSTGALRGIDGPKSNLTDESATHSLSALDPQKYNQIDYPSQPKHSIDLSKVNDQYDNKNNSHDLPSREDSNNFKLDNNQSTVENDETVSQRSSKSSPRSRPTPSYPQTVRLLNTYTMKYQDIAPLSKFIKMGYTKQEIVALRPQVLEFIVEDNIPKPRSGIPSRWVRDFERDEETDDIGNDFDWAVQIVEDPRESISQRSDVVRSDGFNGDATIRADTIIKNSKVRNLELSVEGGVHSKISVPPQQNEYFSSTQFTNVQKPIDFEGYSKHLEKGDFSTIGKDEKSQQIRLDNGFGQTYNDNYERYEDERNLQEARRRRQPALDENDENQKREVRSSPRRSYSNVDDEFSDRGSFSQRVRSRNGEQRRSSHRSKRLSIDQRVDNYDRNPPPNKFWMDLPTFSDYLRTEARLRLQILGPDWKESVLDESRWRFNLYKRWLLLLNDGVGENILYTYGDRPKQQRDRRLSRKEKLSYESPSRQVYTRRRQYKDDGDEEESLRDRDDEYQIEESEELRNTEGNQKEEDRPKEYEDERRRSQTTSSSFGNRRQEAVEWKNFGELERNARSSVNSSPNRRRDVSSYEELDKEVSQDIISRRMKPPAKGEWRE